VDDEYLGEAVKAYVVLQSNDQISELEIKTFCKKKLPLYKHPKFIEIINDLPKNKSGKILKNKLKEQHKNSVVKN
jgi:long-chain acyl-CoA synthetase